MNLIIDGQTFNVGIINVERKTRIEKENKGTTLDGKVHYEVLGTYIDYIITISSRRTALSEYDRLYQLISSPIAEHTITVPYNQSNITINANITVGNSSVIQDFNNYRMWGEIKISCESIEPREED